MKKLIAILLCGIMVLGLFAGCNNSNNNETEPAGTTADGKTVITIGMPTKITVENYDTNSLTCWIEEELDIEIVIQPYATAAADAKTQLATQLLDESIKLPDLLLNFSLGDSVWKQYGEDGYFLSLDEWWTDKDGAAKVWWDRLAELGLPAEHTEAIYERCKADDGHLYAFPRIEECKIDTMDYLVQVNTEWLKATGKSSPTNLGELEDVLAAFHDYAQTLGTGNYALLAQSSGAICSKLIEWAINLKTYYDGNKQYQLVDGDPSKIEPNYITDGYREGLKLINSWVDKGWLPNNFFSVSAAEVKKLVNGEDGHGHIGILIAHPTVVFTIDSPATWEYEAADCYGYAIRGENLNSRETFITEDCVDPDLCWDILMLLCSQEGAYRTRYGERGLNWDWADDNAEVSYLGLECDMKIVGHDYWGQVNNYMWNDIPSTILPNAELESIQLTDASDWLLQRLNKIAGPGYRYFKYAEDNKNPELTFPVIVMTEAESEETQVERGNVNTTISSWRTAFLKGTKDITDDTVWAAYKAELERQGMIVAWEQMQTIYTERYYERVLNGEI